MTVDTSAIGKATGAWKVTVERGPVSTFAAALQDSNPIYRDVNRARAAGFDNIPAPPTFTFAMSFWGSFTEEQPPDPTGGANPMHTIMGELFAKGALVLHGEQEFEYHRPVEVGDVLVGEGRIKDLYEKETDSAHMTFVVMQTQWKDADSGAPVVTEQFNLIARLKK
ncbi:MAG TPA: MaoC family dehydratase N-terminal domain-containing protein [Acidimicrobiia bacterium]|jgi:acyl dehydratase